MGFSQKSVQFWATRVFIFSLGLAIAVYLLRGFAVLSMIPGGVIWGLILLTIATGVLAALQNIRQRY